MASSICLLYDQPSLRSNWHTKFLLRQTWVQYHRDWLAAVLYIKQLVDYMTIPKLTIVHLTLSRQGCGKQRMQPDGNYQIMKFAFHHTLTNTRPQANRPHNIRQFILHLANSGYPNSWRCIGPSPCAGLRFSGTCRISQHKYLKPSSWSCRMHRPNPKLYTYSFLPTSPAYSYIPSPQFRSSSLNNISQFSILARANKDIPHIHHNTKPRGFRWPSYPIIHRVGVNKH